MPLRSGKTRGNNNIKPKTKEERLQEALEALGPARFIKNPINPLEKEERLRLYRKALEELKLTKDERELLKEEIATLEKALRISGLNQDGGKLRNRRTRRKRGTRRA